MSTPSAPPRKGWNVALWTVQIVLALMFGMAGVMKATQPIADLAAQMGWPGAIPPWLVRFIGASEFTAALGLILPSALRIRPVLTPLAAAGLVVVMVLALGFHASRGEFFAFPINAGLGALAVFVAWGRSRKAPIPPR
ncbi:MAG TPA: DoxX family protein [Rhodothermales bacterium]|nr:DoxX family protein [Rhodothermales bacterium]